MDKTSAWNRFHESGAIADYLAFLKCCASDTRTEAKKNENDNRRSGAEGDGYRRK